MKTSHWIASLWYVSIGSVLAVFATSAQAWNSGGHRLVAGIAWEVMTPIARQEASQLLRRHPDYPRWLSLAGDHDTERRVFIATSTWADEIRKDPRFYTPASESPTPLLSGFPDMIRHGDWHYEARPLDEAAASAPGRPTSGAIGKGLSSQARELQGHDNARRAYALPWITHLVGDVHQPLHVSLKVDTAGNWDKLGIAQQIHQPNTRRKPITNLHVFWDDLPGSYKVDSKELDVRIESLLARHRNPPRLASPAIWLDESWTLARQAGYPVGKGEILEITPEFLETSREITDRRLAEAGYRLGEWLNALLGKKRVGQ